MPRKPKKIELAPGICYYDKRNWKYELADNYRTVVRILPEADIHSEYITLNRAGVLSIGTAYAWDGPSGPTHDDAQGMLASLVHDALYQLMRERILPHTWRKMADKELVLIAKECGMPWCRRRAWYRAVRLFAGRSLDRDD